MDRRGAMVAGHSFPWQNYSNMERILVDWMWAVMRWSALQAISLTQNMILNCNYITQMKRRHHSCCVCKSCRLWMRNVIFESWRVCQGMMTSIRSSLSLEHTQNEQLNLAKACDPADHPGAAGHFTGHFLPFSVSVPFSRTHKKFHGRPKKTPLKDKAQTSWGRLADFLGWGPSEGASCQWVF